MKAFNSLAAALAVVCLLGGCSVLGIEKTTDTYDLSAASFPTGPSTGRQVLIPEPVAVRALDTERIVVRPKPSELNYFPGAQWSDRLPKLVQTRLVQSFENSGRIRAGRPGQGLLIDYQVVTEIRAFEYDAGTRKAHVEISAKLMNDRSGRVLAVEVFRADVDCAGDGAVAIVAALDQALDGQLKAIVGWTLKRV